MSFKLPAGLYFAPLNAVRTARRAVPASLARAFAAVLILAGALGVWGSESDSTVVAAQRAFNKVKSEYESRPLDAEAAWHFARASFDLADVATNKNQRSGIAQQGIAACKQALARTPDSAPLHYYLGLNEGQLARTRTFGALKLVDQMEIEFTKAIDLNASFDYAGPDRSLGLLYRDAPALGSIGSRTKAREHLKRALELAPQYPENRLNLIESEVKWGDRKSAGRELKLLEDSWLAARAEFSGPAWSASWTDWEDRLDKVKKKLEDPARSASHH